MAQQQSGRCPSRVMHRIRASVPFCGSQPSSRVCTNAPHHCVLSSCHSDYLPSCPAQQCRLLSDTVLASTRVCFFLAAPPAALPAAPPLPLALGLFI